jgi:hypothetical protein
MNDYFKQIFYVLILVGFISFLYISFKYILPFLFTVFSTLLGIILNILIIVLAISAIVYCVNYIRQNFKK